MREAASGPFTRHSTQLRQRGTGMRGVLTFCGVGLLSVLVWSFGLSALGWRARCSRVTWPARAIALLSMSAAAIRV